MGKKITHLLLFLSELCAKVAIPADKGSVEEVRPRYVQKFTCIWNYLNYVPKLSYLLTKAAWKKSTHVDAIRAMRHDGLPPSSWLCC